MARRQLPRLRLQDMSDMELLLVLHETLDGDGKATALEVARNTDEGEEIAVSVGQRFAWLKRWGVLYGDGRPAVWSFTPEGERLLQRPELSSRDHDRIAKLKQENPLGLARAFGGARSSLEGEKLAKRELTYQETRWQLQPAARPGGTR
jgi:hypothetical protein